MPVMKTSTDTPNDPQASALDKFADLPKDVGWMLLISGLMSELGAPGVPPFWIMGVMILWPEVGVKISKPVQKHFPKLFAASLTMVTRYVDDLERKYPQR